MNFQYRNERMDDEDEDERPELDRGSDAAYQKLLERRIIWLGEEVTNQNANAICAKMLLLSEKDPDRDIILYINSPGGSISDGMSIYDVMQFVKPDVVTVGIGLSASMGQFLLSSGTKGKRFALPHTRIMMHQPLGGIIGKVTDVRVSVKEILYLKKMLTQLISQQTGKSVEQINADIENHEVWFTAEEAKEYGFIDHVIQNEDELPIGAINEKD